MQNTARISTETLRTVPKIFILRRNGGAVLSNTGRRNKSLKGCGEYICRVSHSGYCMPTVLERLTRKKCSTMVFLSELKEQFLVPIQHFNV
jgi:hypothetical protein